MKKKIFVSSARESDTFWQFLVFMAIGCQHNERKIFPCLNYNYREKIKNTKNY